MTMEQIKLVGEAVKQIKEGKINRDNDEKYAGGFWDCALSIAEPAEQVLSNDDYWDLVDDIYNALWGVYEEK
ncbi:MAG TPA: hypothetical protein P5556_10785 [Candidatus Gastranaerophilales bacterium]|nr:hypothetical protein [Candidatus Gastranaerophilales bacterium]